MKTSKSRSNLGALVTALFLGITSACGPQDNSKTDSNNTNSQDAGYVDSGFPDGGDVSDGGSDNLPPVVIIEAKDQEGNVKTEFPVNSYVTFDLNKSYDPDCEVHNSCGESKGMDYCDWQDGYTAGKLYFKPLSVGTKTQHYPVSNRDITFSVVCFDKEGLSTLSSLEIHINI